MNTKIAKSFLKAYVDDKRLRAHITNTYRIKKGSRLRRGETTTDIFRSVGLNKNPANYELLHNIMKEFGVRLIKVNSKAYFGELAKRDI